MLEDREEAVKFQLITPGIDVSVSVGDAISSRMRISADYIEDDAHEYRVRSFLTRLVQIL